VHGKAAAVRHDGTGLFAGLPDPLATARYHSLIVDIEDNHPALRVTARTNDGIVMAMEHRSYPCHGVQFHPESILTEGGSEIMVNFLSIADAWNNNRRGAA
jgi:anthranilate/para-aminobenzoate synthase component II